jgi:hypothetical protein
MVFVDGENLTMRYQELMRKRNTKEHLDPSEWYEPDVFLWSDILNSLCDFVGVTRKHYYTSVTGSDETRENIEERLKAIDIEAPYVFKKPKKAKNRHSKGVDIALAVDMLTHASRKIMPWLF